MSSRALRKLHGKHAGPPEMPGAVEEESEEEAEEGSQTEQSNKSVNPFDLVGVFMWPYEYFRPQPWRIFEVRASIVSCTISLERSDEKL